MSGTLYLISQLVMELFMEAAALSVPLAAARLVGIFCDIHRA